METRAGCAVSPGAPRGRSAIGPLAESRLREPHVMGPIEFGQAVANRALRQIDRAQTRANWAEPPQSSCCPSLYKLGPARCGTQSSMSSNGAGLGNAVAKTLSMRFSSMSTTSKRQPAQSAYSPVAGIFPSKSIIMPLRVW